nr:hypothetical protein [Bacillus velezensis]
MVRHLSVQYNDEHMPLIHTVVSLNEIHSLQFKEDTATDTLFHFDLENNGIHLKLFYNGNLYDERYINQIVSHLDQFAVCDPVSASSRDPYGRDLTGSGKTEAIV